MSTGSSRQWRPQASCWSLTDPGFLRNALRLDAAPPSGSEIRGDLHIDGDRRSLFYDGARHMLAVLVCESAF
jgi:hypothetical protein